MIFDLVFSAFLTVFCLVSCVIQSSGGGLQDLISNPPPHRTFTSPPSLWWPGRELRKYHYPRCLSSPPPFAFRILSHGLYRSPFRGPGAPVSVAPGIGNVPDDRVIQLSMRFREGGLLCPLTLLKTKNTVFGNRSFCFYSIFLLVYEIPPHYLYWHEKIGFET